MQLKDYIQGNRQGKEANRLEREAMNDPFLQGALDGFDSVDGDHVKIIEQLEEKYTGSTAALQPKKRNLFYWVAAASILLFIGFGAYFLLEKPKQNMPVFAEVQPVKSENVTTADSSLPELESENKSKTLIVSQESRPALDAESPVKNIDKNQVRNDTFIPFDMVSKTESNVAVVDSHSSSEQSETTPLVAEITDKERTQTIQGKVLDETGEPVVGASIVEEGTQNGTITDSNGFFTLQLPTDDSSKLIASYLGYERKEINPSDENKTVILKEDNKALSEVVVVGYGVQKRSSLTVGINAKDSIQNIFGEKEFQVWCQQKANKNICAGSKATVKVSFFINEKGIPSNIGYKKYSCDAAKKEMENLLFSSPVWTKTNRKVTMTIYLN